MEIHPIKSLNAFYCERLLWLSYSEQSSMHVLSFFQTIYFLIKMLRLSDDIFLT